MNGRAIALLLLGSAVVQPTGVSAQQQGPPTCSAEEHRQFDFWLGTWDVFDPDGRQVGMNEITMELNGCVLHEHWQSLGGPHRGNSYNIYDRTTGRWHQTWVDNSGLLLQLDGGLVDGNMVLEGETLNPEGDRILNRITWSREEEGTVRQLWEMSEDGGESWTVAFDGRYVKRR